MYERYHIGHSTSDARSTVTSPISIKGLKEEVNILMQDVRSTNFTFLLRKENYPRLSKHQPRNSYLQQKRVSTWVLQNIWTQEPVVLMESWSLKLHGQSSFLQTRWQWHRRCTVLFLEYSLTQQKRLQDQLTNRLCRTHTPCTDWWCSSVQFYSPCWALCYCHPEGLCSSVLCSEYGFSEQLSSVWRIPGKMWGMIVRSILKEKCPVYCISF